MVESSRVHVVAKNHMLRYLEGTNDYALCYPLICTIVGLAEEPPIDKHVQCLIPVYQLIRLYV